MGHFLPTNKKTLRLNIVIKWFLWSNQQSVYTPYFPRILIEESFIMSNNGANSFYIIKSRQNKPILPLDIFKYIILEIILYPCYFIIFHKFFIVNQCMQVSKRFGSISKLESTTLNMQRPWDVQLSSTIACIFEYAKLLDLICFIINCLLFDYFCIYELLLNH